MRRIMDRATSIILTERLCFAMIVAHGSGDLAGPYAGTPCNNLSSLEDRAKRLFGVWYAEVPRTTAAPWLSVVGAHVQKKLVTECYPQLVGAYDTPFEAAYGFRSLLGAMYLQMYWLMTSRGEGRRCKGPGCRRVIAFDQPEQPRDPWIHNDRSRGYRTRRDKVFCSQACKQRDYDRRKKMSRT